jgi:hypothetical protein
MLITVIATFASSLAGLSLPSAFREESVAVRRQASSPLPGVVNFPPLWLSIASLTSPVIALTSDGFSFES